MACETQKPEPNPSDGRDPRRGRVFSPAGYPHPVSVFYDGLDTRLSTDLADLSADRLQGRGLDSGEFVFNPSRPCESVFAFVACERQRPFGVFTDHKAEPSGRS